MCLIRSYYSFDSPFKFIVNTYDFLFMFKRQVPFNIVDLIYYRTCFIVSWSFKVNVSWYFLQQDNQIRLYSLFFEFKIFKM